MTEESPENESQTKTKADANTENVTSTITEYECNKYGIETNIETDVAKVGTEGASTSEGLERTEGELDESIELYEAVYR